VSRLFRNVPIVNYLEMSPFVVAVEQNIAVAQYEPGWGARGEGPARMRPFQFAHRLIKLQGADLLVLRFPEKNFVRGWPQSDDFPVEHREDGLLLTKRNRLCFSRGSLRGFYALCG
jgi:hypothetical protein